MIYSDRIELQPSSTIRATEGMVCTIDHLASQAALTILKSGGCAVDAAIAANAVLTVTTQNRCGIGGDLLALISQPGVDPVAMNSSGFAGAGADAGRMRAEGHTNMPFRGHIATVTVPGCVDGWIALHERYGKMSLGELLAPAIHYATHGFPAAPLLVSDFASVAHMPESADYTATGTLKMGTIVKRPGIARALTAIVQEGRSGFYEGEFGEELIAVGAGEFVASDLSVPLARWQEGLSTTAWGHNIWTMPPNSQGYITLSTLQIASGLKFPDDPTDPAWTYLLIEAARQASFDRLSVLHDNADGKSLIAESRLAPRRDAIDPLHAAVLGDTYQEGGTIALSVVDKDRMGISLVQSNAADFGSHLAVPNMRIYLHNRGMGFSLDPGHPAEYVAGHRPPHTLCPTLITRPDGTLSAVVGTSGGDTQPQILSQLITRLLLRGEDVGDAVAAGRWKLANPTSSTGFDTWEANGAVRVVLEANAPMEWKQSLTDFGHHVSIGPSFDSSFGNANVIAVLDDHLAGASDPRPRFGAAAAY